MIQGPAKNSWTNDPSRQTQPLPQNTKCPGPYPIANINQTSVPYVEEDLIDLEVEIIQTGQDKSMKTSPIEKDFKLPVFETVVIKTDNILNLYNELNCYEVTNEHNYCSKYGENVKNVWKKDERQYIIRSDGEFKSDHGPIEPNNFGNESPFIRTYENKKKFKRSPTKEFATSNIIPPLTNISKKDERDDGEFTDDQLENLRVTKCKHDGHYGRTYGNNKNIKKPTNKEFVQPSSIESNDDFLTIDWNNEKNSNIDYSHKLTKKFVESITIELVFPNEDNFEKAVFGYAPFSSDNNRSPISNNFETGIGSDLKMFQSENVYIDTGSIINVDTEKGCDNKFSIDSKNKINNNPKFKYSHDGLFQCPHCPIRFKIKENIQLHIKNLHSDKSEKSLLKDNIFIAKWMGDLECYICNCCTFKTFTLLQDHFNIEHPNDEFYVECCSKQMDDRYTLIEHIQYHLNPNSFQCKICGRRVKNKRYLKKHIIKLHTNYIEGRRFECEVCQKRFINLRDLRTHFELHYPEKTHICKICYKEFSTVQRLRKHKYNSHKTRKLCEQCGKTFRDTNAFKNHLDRHLPNKWPCDICGAKLNSRGSLYYHKKACHHDSSTIYVCSVCGKISATKASLTYHKKLVHDAYKAQTTNINNLPVSKYQCKICDKMFEFPPSLRKHMLKHNVKPPNQCPYCPTLIKSKSNLYRHMLHFHPNDFVDPRNKRPTRSKIDLSLVVNEIVI